MFSVLSKATNHSFKATNHGLNSARQLSTTTLSKASLTIKNGPVFKGFSFGADKSVSGEAVFTTSLVGYPESMSDPSYKGQILCFTQPLIGNYGVPSSTVKDQFNLLKYFESPHIQCTGIVVGDVALKYSHWTAVESLSDWCKKEGVAGITGVDTRALVTYLREQGSSLGRIDIGTDKAASTSAEYIDPGKMNLVSLVSTKKPFKVVAPHAKYNILVIDCGVKENILRNLVKRDASITVVPYDYPIQNIVKQFDGLFITNGPGDPTFCSATVHNLRQTMSENKDLPIMGICLGHQLLALASGAKTIKLKYGNRAHNIPTLDLTTGQCHITSQNHGYAVDATTLASDFQQYFINLNDMSNEGMISKTRPIFSTQFHPEAKGGPLDTAFLFDRFFENVQKYHPTGKEDTPIDELFSTKLANERVLQ